MGENGWPAQIEPHSFFLPGMGHVMGRGGKGDAGGRGRCGPHWQAVLASPGLQLLHHPPPQHVLPEHAVCPAVGVPPAVLRAVIGGPDADDHRAGQVVMPTSGSTQSSRGTTFRVVFKLCVRGNVRHHPGKPGFFPVSKSLECDLLVGPACKRFISRPISTGSPFTCITWGRRSS